ncbi:TetR family transcriptional regulator [Microbacterium soli]|uniref:TetR family transcriptional regulator n=1 Tax=Microbacterium soli TaxID=446075 RepID=A0ABP7N094_9MICO
MDDDRTARARLRDAAIEIIANGGSDSLTARGVAERAGLSAGLIRHHFGSMGDLLTACDEHIARTIKRLKTDGIRGSASFDALSVIRQSNHPHLLGYLAMRVSEDSPVLDRLIDLIVDDATVYLADGVEQGIFTPTAQPRRRAVMLTIFTLGALALHRHLERLLDVDLRAVDAHSDRRFIGYLRAQMDVLAGVVTPDAASRYRSLLDDLEEQS